MRIPIGFAETECKNRLDLQGRGHFTLLAPTGSGKGATIEVPICLTYPDSMLVVDPTGQLAAVTGPWRKKMGHEVYVVNPFGLFIDTYLKDFPDAKLNPLSKIDPEDECFAADMDAVMMGLVAVSERDPFWGDGAIELTSGIAQVLRLASDDANVVNVKRVVSGGKVRKFCKDAIAADPGGYVVERLGCHTVASRENRCIISTASKALGFVSNGPIARNLSASTIDLREMKKRRITIYLVLPARRLHSCNKWFTLWISTWAEAMLESPATKIEVLGLVDEFASTVGKLPIAQTMMSMALKYGCRMFNVLQDLNQLKGLFPQTYETFLANSTHMWFAPRDWSSCEYLSRMCGTVQVPSISTSISSQQKNPIQFGGVMEVINSGIRSAVSGGSQVSVGSRDRRFLLPEEIRDLGRDFLMFGDFKGVLRGGRKNYWEDPAYAGQYSTDPYHTKGGN